MKTKATIQLAVAEETVPRFNESHSASKRQNSISNIVYFDEDMKNHFSGTGILETGSVHSPAAFHSGRSILHRSFLPGISGQLWSAMKIILSVLILIFLKVNCFGQETIHWYTWEDAVELQKESPRKIFIDIYTSWCGWCKKMNASTFKDSTVVSVMNKYYYAVKFDAEQKDTLMFDGHAFVNVILPHQKERILSLLLCSTTI